MKKALRRLGVVPVMALAEYPVTVLTSVTHVTVVIDGREAVSARPFDHAAGRVVIR